MNSPPSGVSLGFSSLSPGKVKKPSASRLAQMGQEVADGTLVDDDRDASHLAPQHGQKSGNTFVSSAASPTPSCAGGRTISVTGTDDRDTHTYDRTITGRSENETQASPNIPYFSATWSNQPDRHGSCFIPGAYNPKMPKQRSPPVPEDVIAALPLRNCSIRPIVHSRVAFMLITTLAMIHPHYNSPSSSLAQAHTSLDKACTW